MRSAIRRALGRESQAAPWNNEESIREELFSVERLEQHAESLAVAQTVTARPTRRRPLAARLKENESALLGAYRAIAGAVDEGRAITPAAEWLLDNYHLVEEQIREIRDDLPPTYYRQLPKLAAGPFAGYPRVFGLAWAFVAHTDSRFDPEMLRRFVRAYQRVEPLTIGELWAVAITLRIVLVENLRRGAKRIMAGRAARQEADALADRLLGVSTSAAAPIPPTLQHYEDGPLPAAFAVQLVQRLREQDPKVTPALVWLDERLAAQGTTADAIVHEEHQRQGATNVTVRNVITSMRLISDVDWADLVESVSLIDEALRSGSEFADMDFPTRNLYRSAIEELARGSRLSELEITRAAMAAAGDRALGKPEKGEDPDGHKRDPGYYLIAGGRRAFEATVGFRAPMRSWPDRFGARIGIGGYAGGVVAVAAIVLALPLVGLPEAGIGGWWLVALAVLGLIPSIDASMALVNRGVTNRLGATILPGLALRDGVPARLRTVVAVPALLRTPAALEEQIERLEIHHLGNPDGELHFALLSDWTDAATETVAGDEALLDAAVAGIARLNRRYGPAAGGDRFLLFHRRRVWNDGQRRWIGWERKRGKLHELNRLLRGAADTTFVEVGGRLSAPPAEVRYVITLDADTRMPRETARRLVGKMAHPLNRPRFDAATRRVIEGYGVLQPRVTPSLPIGREGSLFQRVFSSPGGIDPYAAAVSDVYQDLFGEGSYTGKGIYDIDAFEAALEGRVSESTLLSHDLFEGTFARAGLASDIEVVEEFPSRYDVAAGRQHRWARGDWQLLPWIFGRADLSADARSAGALPPIGRWKMLDNLRRSLSAPTGVAALVAGWTLPLPAAAVWTAFIVFTLVLPALLPVLAEIVPRRPRVTARSHLRALAADVRLALSQSALLVVFLAHQAWLMADAIGRTLARLGVTRRHLLDWVTAGQAKLSPRPDLAGFYGQMKGGVGIGIAAAAVVWWARSDAWPLAAPFVIAWIASPAIARWTSLSPLVAGRLPVAAADTLALRLVARRTWRFFETFVTPTDHMLPPDNFQEDPRPVVAHRTSPTNLGVYLLSAVSARDFGWAGTIETVERLEATLATMDRLPRFRGHFYNWYDTRRASSARPAIRLLGGQRQPGRASDRAGERLPGMARPSDGGPRVGRRRRGRRASHARIAAVAPRRSADADRHPAAARRCARCARRRAARAHRAAGDRCATGGDRAACRHDGRHRPHARERTRRRRRRRDALLGGGNARVDREPPARRRAGRLRRPRRRSASRDAGNRGAGDGRRDGVRLSPGPGAPAALDRVSRRGRHARPELLRPARLRGAPRELRRDRQGRRPFAPLVPARTRRHPDRTRRGARLVVGIDVRVPDALARDARADGQPARGDKPPRRPAAGGLWRRARRALGDLGVRL